MSNLNDLELVDDQAMAINPEANAYEKLPPPPDDTYVCKLKLGSQGFTAGKTKNDEPYIMAAIEARIVKEGDKLNNVPLFDRVSTVVLQNVGTSAMATLLVRGLGQKVPRSVTRKELATMLDTALAAEPLVRVTTEWQARTEIDPGKWKTIARGMKRFPPRKDADGNVVAGQYVPVLSHKDYGEVDAQIAITDYLPLAS